MDKVSKHEMQSGSGSFSYREMLLRQNQKKHKRKKTIMGRLPAGSLPVIVFCMFMLPLALSFVFSGQTERKDTAGEEEIRTDLQQTAETDYYVICDRSSGTLEIPMEEYLVSALSQTMSAAQPKEALMAMAVLLRTQVVYESEQMGACVADSVRTLDELKDALGTEGAELFENYVNAVEETSGIIITYQGLAIETAYHQISAGATRDAAEVFGDRFPYLVSAVCEEDMMSVGYLNRISFSRAEFFEYLKELTGCSTLTTAEVSIDARDEAGYVLSLTVQGEEFDSIRVGGETFRKLLGLPSSHFDMEENDKNVIFSCRGAGHGFGLSINKACSLAQDGNDFMDIIRYFYQDIVFMRIA